ncbi:hypothetical protein LB452_11740 [Psychroflexus sp. CAK8W]|uniref:Lipoprotein n=1 Tax=Psychroflexus longus TaxID=2873596 RepID=A0ABS7XKW7_9FLAO|nr:hypothetical protein [Psychroflexus longus]MBZ9779593.1 hypothetical protein [Psychroflexus longus]
MKQLYFILIIVLLASCQDEEFFEQVEDTTSLSSQSELSNLISRLTQNPTAFDDFIDNSSSIQIEFPYEVKVNSETTYTLNEFSDYQPLIQELPPQSEDYTININFPVNVSLPNYEVLTIQNQAEFLALDASVEGSSEINCLEYNFPIDINSFDVDNGITNRRTIQNKAQLYNLIQDLKQNNGFYQFIYPITVTVEGQAQSLSSNLDLNSTIDNLDEDCFNPSLLTNNSYRMEQFIAFITSNQFGVLNFIDEGQNKTLDYENYRFTFNTDANIFVKNLISGETFSGDWSAEINDDNLNLDLDFEENDILEELEEDWIVEGFANPNRIILNDENNLSENSILIFEKI